MISMSGHFFVLKAAPRRTVQRWEAGDNDIPGPVIALVDPLLHVPDARKRLSIPAPALEQKQDKKLQ